MSARQSGLQRSRLARPRAAAERACDRKRLGLFCSRSRPPPKRPRPQAAGSAGSDARQHRRQQAAALRQPSGSGLLGTSRVPGGGAPACFTEVTQRQSSGCRSRLRALAGGRTDRQPASAAETGFAKDSGGAGTWSSLAAAWSCAADVPAGVGAPSGTGEQRGGRTRSTLPGARSRGRRRGRPGGGCSWFPRREGRKRGTQKEFYHVAGSAEIRPTYFHLKKRG